MSDVGPSAEGISETVAAPPAVAPSPRTRLTKDSVRAFVRREVRALASTRNLCVYAVVLLICRAWSDLYVRLSYEAHGPIVNDTPIFAAIGRGILNHVPLYSGLFETKPPVIFLIFALSIALTHSWRLATALQILAFVALMVTPLVLVVRDRKHLGRVGWRLVAAGLGGAVVVLYAADRGGELEVEPYGAALLLPWLWLWCRAPSRAARALSTREARARVLLGGASLACACLTKEPFLLSAIAIALINVRTRAHVYELIRMGVTSGVFAALVLLLCGAFTSYFRIYLPEMFLHQAFAVDADALGPSKMLDKAFDWGRLHDATDFAPAAGFAFAGAAMAAMQEQRATEDGWMPVVTRWGLAVVLSSLAIGVSGRFYAHHFVFMVPWVLAVLATWLLTDEVSDASPVPRRFASALAVLAIAVVTLIHDRPDLRQKLSDMKHGEEQGIAAARAVDAAATCMGEERYVSLSKNGLQPWGWTTHSPVGPFFFQYDFWFDHTQTAHREQLLKQLTQSRLLVLTGYSTGEFDGILRAKVEARFKPGLPPKCAYIKIAEPWSFRWAPGP